MDRIGIIGGTGLVSIDIEAEHANDLESRGFEIIRTDEAVSYTHLRAHET